MSTVLNQLSISQHGHYLAADMIQLSATMPFKDHQEFALLSDSLSRKEHHHLALSTPFSYACRIAFLQAFLLYLVHDHTPLRLRKTELLILDIEHLLHSKKQLSDTDFDELHAALESSDHYVLFAITHFDLLIKENNQLRHHFLRSQFERLLAHPNCRMMLLTPHKLNTPITLSNHQFTSITLSPLSDNDHLAFLKSQRDAYEKFHQVVIPDDLLSQAYALANRYLNTNNTLDNALLLLDSSAARASLEPNATLTLTTMLETLSSWIHIPASHLQTHSFKTAEFLDAMRERLYGQETALVLLSDALQKSHARLIRQSGVFCHITLAGPAHTGKKTMALALVEQLFKQLGAFYIAELSSHVHHISNIKVKRFHDNQYVLLKEVLQKSPFAVLMFNIHENTSPDLIEQLNDIITTGQLQDPSGYDYLFYQTTIIINTILGADRLTHLAETFTQDESHLTDIFQIVSNNFKHHHDAAHLDLSPEEILNAIKPDLESQLPPALCQHVIPFFPLQIKSIEKIIQQKLKVLNKQLNIHYHIELGYAPEVIHYLANMPFKNVDHTLKQLYFCVEQALSHQHAMKNQSNQLFLQLNETGDVLRCDWISEPAANVS